MEEATARCRPADDDKTRLRCTNSGFVGTFDDFDVLLADSEKLFCNECNSEASLEELAEQNDD